MRNRILIVAVLVILALTAVALQMRSSERIDELASRELLSPEQQQQLAGLERITLSKGESSVELALLTGTGACSAMPASRYRRNAWQLCCMPCVAPG